MKWANIDTKYANANKYVVLFSTTTYVFSTIESIINMNKTKYFKWKPRYYVTLLKKKKFVGKLVTHIVMILI